LSKVYCGLAFLVLFFFMVLIPSERLFAGRWDDGLVGNWQ